MIKFKNLLILATLATGTAFSTPAAAAILVDTGAPITLGGVGLNSVQSLAAVFTLASATTVTSVEGFVRGVGGIGTISILTGGVDPGFSGLLFTANYTMPNKPTGGWQGVFGQSWNLAAGQYWVVYSTTANGGNFMSFPAPRPLPQYAILQSSGRWLQSGALGLGVRITNDRAVVTPPIPGAVPEPATWAMMLIGFGVVGGALRARRRVSVSYG